MMKVQKDCHQFGWYYGAGHFIAKAVPFVCAGLHQRARILTFVGPNLAEQFIMAVHSNWQSDLPHDAFGLTPLHRLGSALSNHGVRGLRREMIRLVQDGRAAGFHRLCLLGQVSEELLQTGMSLEAFLAWEKAFHKATNGLPIDTLCMYDAALMFEQQQLNLCHHDSVNHRSAGGNSLAFLQTHQRG